MFTSPIKNLKALGLREHDIVVDLGAGTGHYSIAAGELLPNGKIYAIEIVKDYLTTIKNKVKDAHLNNVHIIWGNIEKKGGTKMKDHVADAVILSNVLFQVESKDALIEEARRILKKGGRALLVDWSDVASSVGVSFEKVVNKDKALEMFQKKGFIKERDIDAGAHHYGMILVKQ